MQPDKKSKQKDYFSEYLLVETLVKQQKRFIDAQEVEIQKLKRRIAELEAESQEKDNALSTYSEYFKLDISEIGDHSKLIQKYSNVRKANKDLTKHNMELSRQVKKTRDELISVLLKQAS